jgi:hypothetical protein
VKRVCVFSGSSPGADLASRAAANDLGHGLAERGIELVYGGAHVGLMGALAERFVTPAHRAMLLVGEELGELLDGLASWEAPAQPKWIDRAAS